MKTTSVALMCILWFIACCGEREYRITKVASKATSRPVSKPIPKLVTTQPVLLGLDHKDEWKKLKNGNLVTIRFTGKVGMVKDVDRHPYRRLVTGEDYIYIYCLCGCGRWRHYWSRQLRWPTKKERQWAEKHRFVGKNAFRGLDYNNEWRKLKPGDIVVARFTGQVAAVNRVFRRAWTFRQYLISAWGVGSHQGHNYWPWELRLPTQEEIKWAKE